MTFLKHDKHGIPVLYVSLSGADHFVSSLSLMSWSFMANPATKGCHFYQVRIL